MYRHLAPHLHIAALQGGFVLLDALHDRYIPLSLSQSRALRALVDGPRSQASLGADARRYANFFERAGIILAADADADADAPGPCFFGEPEVLTQPFEGWHIRPEDFDHRVSLYQVLRAVSALHHVHRQMQKFRLHGLIKYVERLHSGAQLHDRPVADYGMHVAALNRACMLHPRRATCLVWAVTLIVLAAREGGRLDLVLGVTRSPFYAHAWAESAGSVVGEDPNRRKQFAVICEVGATRRSPDASIDQGGA